MRQPTQTAKVNHPWSKDALLIKAQRYAQEMLSHSRDDWRFGLTSTFVLEFLARAALANISPALLADSKDWNNIFYALGHTPTAPKYLPRSIDLSAVLSRLKDIHPNFTPDLEGFAAQHINRRNEELHAGTTPFDGLPPTWLANFYLTASVLLDAVGERLAFLVGGSEEAFAKQLIDASRDESAKAVNKAVAAHKTVWEATDATERAKLEKQAGVWATRQSGHRVKCPACTSDALLIGAPITAPIRKLENDLIIETQDYLPSKFECVACKLKISGLPQLTACNLGATYKSTFTYDAADYYAPDDAYMGYEDDNNEP
ncbi:MAG: hypothetical protein K2X64_03920 [Rhodocyclaceae bacterium]|nr:hypothetical protein [Rhodocyclaceae bacterium]